MNVYAVPDVIKYLETLVDVLFDKEYFSYQQSAEIYVSELFDDMITNLPDKRHKPAPKHYDKYGKGMYYAAFVKNKRTTWYAFFTKYANNGETIYLIRYIGNNHTEAHHLYDASTNR